MSTVDTAGVSSLPLAKSRKSSREKAAPHEAGLAGWIKSKWWVGLLLVVLCFIGVALVWQHWTAQGWLVRGAELGGTQQGRMLDEANDRLRPVLGLLLMAAGALIGWVVSAGALARRMMCAAGWTLIALIGVHLIEDELLEATVYAAPAGAHLKAYTLWLQGTAFVDEALLPIAGMVALLGAVTALNRLVTRFALACRGGPEGNDGAPLDVEPLIEDKDRANWRHNSKLPSERVREIKDEEEEGQRRLGICLSGGGIRSASFALGALQALQNQTALTPSPKQPKNRHHSELMRAKYLTAVSGGSYIAGAFLLSVLGKEGDHKGNRERLNFDQVFRHGSYESDYLRRHSSYIADGLKEWAAAIFIVLRGAFVSSVILGLIALVAGRWVGYLYSKIGRQADLSSPWHPLWGPVFVTLIVIILALLLWTASTAISLPPMVRKVLLETAKMTGISAGVLVVLGAVIPVTVWASMHIIDLSGGIGPTVGGLAVGAVRGGALGLIGVIVTLFGLMSRQRAQLLKAVRSAETTWRQRLGDTSRRIVQWLCVYTGLAMVAAVYLIVFGYSTSVMATTVNTDEHPVIRWGIPWWTLPLSDFQLTLVLTGLLVLLYLLIDEPALGLHPFYRSRLARAFAIRRVRVPHDAADGRHQPEPGDEFEAKSYDPGVVTKIETYGNPKLAGQEDGNPTPFPHVIFCAAVHCSDPEHTPPGRRVLPFTFSYDAVGGPEIGWCAPECIRKRASKRLGADLTVEGAMAVSGSAFASATGPYQSASNVILALVNARLGTWIVNPHVIGAGNENAGEDAGKNAEKEWWRARPPRIRRLSYLLREIFGWYPQDLPLVFVTDGGLYENLGLLELFRHRCTEIYCFDASSDAETFATSLAQSITLAANELGVIVEPNRPERADPRAGGKDVEAGDLQGRLAETPVITASVRYPPREPNESPKLGTLVIGRATMDPDTPWEVRRHAAAHPLFPNDATGDQWFDDRKFNAYTALGRHVGRKAIMAMLAARGPSR